MPSILPRRRVACSSSSVLALTAPEAKVVRPLERGIVNDHQRAVERGMTVKFNAGHAERDDFAETPEAVLRPKAACTTMTDDLHHKSSLGAHLAEAPLALYGRNE